MKYLVEGFAFGTTDPRLVRRIENFRLMKAGVQPSEIKGMSEQERREILALLTAEERLQNGNNRGT